MQNANYRKIHHRLENSQWIISHCAEATSPQIVLGQRHWDLLPIFRVSTDVSGTSGIAKTSPEGLLDAPGSFGSEVWQQVEHHPSVMLLKCGTLMAIRHHDSCYVLIRAWPAHANSYYTRHVTLDWNSKCSWHGGRYFHNKAHRVYNFFSFKHSHTHSLKIFKTLLSLVTEFIKLYPKSFHLLCCTEYKTKPATL